MKLPDHITALYHRCIQGTASAAEQAELLQYLQEPGNEDVLKEVLRQGLRADKPLTDLSPERETAVWGAIMGATQDHRPVRRFTWMRLSVAAGIAILMGIGSFLLYRNYNTTQQPQMAIHSSLAPGSNKAVLTLGDGKVITLDSIANGAVAGENGVVKQAGGTLAYTEDPAAPLTRHTLTVPRGGQYQLKLADGTQVWLNSASYIKYPNRFEGKERTVEISGEAYLSVAKNATQPFIVMAKGQRIQVLGTEFNLMAYPDESTTKTTLISGAVKVIQAGEEKILKPGEQAEVMTDAKGITISKPDLDNVLAWKEGKFRFNNTDIATIMRQVARWYDVDVIYQGTLTDDEFYGTIPKSENASQILEVLELTNKVHFEIKGKTIIVIPGPAKSKTN